MLRHILPIGTVVLLASCSTLPVPGTSDAAPSAAAREIILKSATTHGDPWKNYRNVEVSYTGEWTGIAKRLQPVLTDPAFRVSSVETYQTATGRVRQLHTGPQGNKSVERRRPDVRVSYNGTPSGDREVLDSAALVADAYTAFLFGPSWLLRNGTDFKLLSGRTLDGDACQLIEGRLAPGLGPSGEDHFIAWISKDSGLMRRFQFTLNGLESTRGADVDVIYSNFQNAPDGSIWPGHFLETIQRPIRAKAHEWRLLSLKLDGRPAKLIAKP